MQDMRAYDRLPKTVRRKLQEALGNRPLEVVLAWRQKGMRASEIIAELEEWDRLDNAGAARAGAMPKVLGTFTLIPRRKRRPY